MTLSKHVKKALKLADPEATKARLSEGRQWIGIKNLEAPDEVQPRAGIDKDWVSQLATFRREGSEFPPARVYQLPNAQLILAEGHHRRWALLGENETDMLCDVVDGTMEEAIVYAAGSNKSNGVKPMSPKDVTKAIEMLFRIEKWWNRSSGYVGRHVGCSSGKVDIIRNKYALTNGKELPLMVEKENGVCNPYKRAKKGEFPKISHEGRPGYAGVYVAKYRGQLYQNASESVLKKRLCQLLSAEDSRRKSLRPGPIGLTLRRIGFEAIKFGVHTEMPGLSGWTGFGIIVVACDWSEVTSLAEAIGNFKLLRICIGRADAGRQKQRTATRSIVLCYVEDGPKKAIDLFKEAGIEFMTPDELIASLGPVIPEELKSDL